MTSAIIVRTFQAADRKGRRGSEQGATCYFLAPRLATRTKASLSAAAADLKSMGCASTRKILVSVRYPVVRDRLRRYVTTGQPIPHNLVGRMPPRSLTFLGNARFKPSKQSSRCVSDTLHLSISFSDAPALQTQLGRRARKCPTRVLKDLTK